MKASVSKKARKNLGNKIRELRLKQKISQAQLAFESGLSREQIYRLELGNKNATFNTLLAIALALNVQPKELFDFEVAES